MIDPNLPRYLMSSLSVRFAAVATTLGINFYVEEVDEDERDDHKQNKAEFRMNGPYTYEGSGVTYHKIELQVLLTRFNRETGHNAYDIFDWAGAYQLSMSTAIPIYDYGDGIVDPVLIGCLEVDSNVREPIRIVNYGQVDRTTRVVQMSVNGKFTFTDLD